MQFLNPFPLQHKLSLVVLILAILTGLEIDKISLQNLDHGGRRRREGREGAEKGSRGEGRKT